MKKYFVRFALFFTLLALATDLYFALSGNLLFPNEKKIGVYLVAIAFAFSYDLIDWINRMIQKGSKPSNP